MREYARLFICNKILDLVLELNWEIFIQAITQLLCNRYAIKLSLRLSNLKFLNL